MYVDKANANNAETTAKSSQNLHMGRSKQMIHIRKKKYKFYLVLEG